ncbi:MAG: hypothetical protein AAGA33_02785 [Pseudomonadota bacterium]
MPYHCPQPADIADVRALNREFLADLLSRHHRGVQDLDRASDDALTRLADVPFLVYELKAPDPGFWDRTFTGASDLLDSAGQGDARDVGQVASTLGFLWHLSRRDVHAARLFAGSSTDWCQGLAETPLVQVIHRALGAGIRPCLRLHDEDIRWRAMVQAASASDKARQIVAVMRVFQALLVEEETVAVVATAACRSRSPLRRFAVRDKR